MVYRYQIVEGVHRRHAPLQKCHHSKREQNHQKINEEEEVELVGVAKARRVVGEVEEECKEVPTVI